MTVAWSGCLLLFLILFFMLVFQLYHCLICVMTNFQIILQLNVDADKKYFHANYRVNVHIFVFHCPDSCLHCPFEEAIESVDSTCIYEVLFFIFDNTKPINQHQYLVSHLSFKICHTDCQKSSAFVWQQTTHKKIHCHKKRLWISNRHVYMCISISRFRVINFCRHE